MTTGSQLSADIAGRDHRRIFSQTSFRFVLVSLVLCACGLVVSFVLDDLAIGVFFFGRFFGRRQGYRAAIEVSKHKIGIPGDAIGVIQRAFKHDFTGAAVAIELCNLEPLALMRQVGIEAKLRVERGT